MAARHLIAVVERDLHVVTRAVYAYARPRGVRFDHIHVLTTRLGFENVMHRLLGSLEHPGSFDRLCAHLGLPRDAVRFDSGHIHTLRHPGGRPIADFREAVDLVSLADQALGFARALAAAGNVDLYITAEHVRLGIAAGFVTAVQLFLRCPGCFCDICLHPLVAFEIERGSMDDFYYPVGPIRVDGVEVPAEEVLVPHELPFIMGRPSDLEAGDDTFASALQAQARLSRWLAAPDPLVIDLATREVRVGDTVVPLAPVPLFWYAVLASMPGRRLRIEALAGAAAHEPGAADVPTPPESQVGVEALRELYRWTFRRTDGFDDLLRLATASRGYLASVVSRLNATLRARVRPHAGPYIVSGGRNNGGYWLALAPSLIRLVGPPVSTGNQGAA